MQLKMLLGDKCRVQYCSKAITPSVDQEFNEEQDKVIKKVQCKNSKFTICGDGRADSPGFSALKGTYTLMDYESKKLLTMEYGNKRKVNLKST